MISRGGGFDLDFEIRVRPPLFRVAVTPFSVVVCESVTDEIIAEVVRLATEDGAHELRPLRPLLGCGEPGALYQYPVLHEQACCCVI